MFRQLTLACLILDLCGCAAGPNYQPPQMALTHSYIAGADIDTRPAAGDGAWWSGFNDPGLERVITRALAQNYDIAAARARVQQSRASAKYAGAALLPRIGADASAAAMHDSINSPVGEIAHAVGASRNYEVYSLGAEASWEVDLFGGLRRGREAAGAEVQSAEISAAGVRITVAAEAADAYLALRGLQQRLAIAESQQVLEASLVDLVNRRLSQGVSSERELHRVCGELERVRASLAPLHQQIEVQLNRLDVLMGSQSGTFRQELEAPVAQPSAPAPIGSPDPAELLRHRPDVAAAERQLVAANARIGAAISEYYPHLSLAGLLGAASVHTGSLLSSDAAQSAGLAGLRWRLFDFGRIDAEVSLARGKQAESLAQYRATVLRATEDVENALSDIANSATEAQALQRQVFELTKARDQTRIAYENGALSLIDVLDADRELLAASDRLAVVKADQARASVASYRALGGGWVG